MVRLAFDIYPPPVTGLGTRLVRLTQHADGTFYQHSMSGLGAGQIVIERDDPNLTAANLAVGNYVIVRDLDFSEVSDSLNVLGSFILQKGDFDLIAEPGKGVLRFGGPSGIALLALAIMGDESLSPFEGPSSIVDGYWRWGSDTYGGVWRRALFEANLQDPPGLGMIDTAWIGADNIHWNDDDDSNGVAWPSFAGEFRTQCGTNLLSLAAELFGYGLEWDFDARTFDMYAYNAGGMGDDVSGTVTFDVGENIAGDLRRRTQGQLPITHVLMRTTDHPEGAFIELSSYSPGDPVRKVAYQSGDISGDPAASAALQERAERLGSLRKLAEDGITFYSSKPEDTWLPGPHAANGATPVGGAGGDYWVGDYIELTSGAEDFDYVAAVKRIETITYELRDGGDWDVLIGVGARVGPGSTNLNIPVGATPVPITLCTALTPGTETVLRFYPSSDATTMTTPPADDAAWNTSQPSLNRLKATPDSTFSTGTATNSNNGVVDAGLWRGSYPLDATLASILSAGGATLVGYFLGNARHGVGINEANQNVISQIGLRVTTGDSATIRGTALALHTATTGLEWPASATEQSRRFPPVDENNVLSAVSGSAIGDFMVVEVGARNLYTGSGGMTLHLNNDSADDIPEVEGDTDNTKNSWIEIRAIGAPSGGGLAPDLVGTERGSASRCDHSHHVISNRAPTAEDDIVQGYPDSTQWTNTETSQTWLLIDEDAGTWLLIGDPNHTHDTAAVAVEDLITDEDDTALVLAPDGSGGVEWVALDIPESSGGIGEILISDTPSTPLVFADLLQNEAQDDLVYGDPE